MWKYAAAGLALTLCSQASAAAGSSDALARAKKIVPEGFRYRLITGSAEVCPGEGVMYWINSSKGAYLQLTPSDGIGGFEKSGWQERPIGPGCTYRRNTTVTADQIVYEEETSCPQKGKRASKRTIARDGELGLKVVSTATAVRADGKALPPLSQICTLQRLKESAR